jgi:hypothetical protein
MLILFRKAFLVLALCASGWLALGNAVQALVASSKNQTIDITVCTSMGLKKVSLPVEKSGQAPAVMKHCGQACFAMLLPPPVHPVHLTFAAPDTVASWAFVQLPGTQTERTWENAPPPLRGPPSRLLA